ncbi:hypothetical protein F4802DRAFT_411347 [Xylaria palmicola]|nr:hypothetical protein F4802DRAFT_411347 [Xylaria palmicola]
MSCRITSPNRPAIGPTDTAAHHDIPSAITRQAVESRDVVMWLAVQSCTRRSLPTGMILKQAQALGSQYLVTSPSASRSLQRYIISQRPALPAGEERCKPRQSHVCPIGAPTRLVTPLNLALPLFGMACASPTVTVRYARRLACLSSPWSEEEVFARTVCASGHHQPRVVSRPGEPVPSVPETSQRSANAVLPLPSRPADTNGQYYLQSHLPRPALLATTRSPQPTHTTTPVFCPPPPPPVLLTVPFLPWWHPVWYSALPTIRRAFPL